MAGGQDNAQLRQSNKEWLEKTKDFALDPATKKRLDDWKKKWGYLPPEPPAMEFANALNERLEQRWLVDRSSADDQLSGKAFTSKRREALENAVGKSYLAEEYGLRTAMDMRPLTEQRGMRAEHPSSSKYVRDNPGGVNALCKSLLAKTAIPPERYNDVFFVNSPTVVDKVRAMYGERVFPASQCTNPACRLTTGGTKTKLRAQKPAQNCPGCDTPLVAYPTVVEIAPGIHGVLPEYNAVGAFPVETPFNEAKDVTALGGQKEVLAEMMKSLGATPSVYQAFKAVNQEKGALALLDAPVDNGAKARQLADESLAGLKKLSADHPMRVVADAAVNLVGGLAAALEGPAPIVLPADAQQKYRVRRQRIEAGLKTFEDARTVEDLKPRWTAFDQAMLDAKARAEESGWVAANGKLDEAENLAKQLRAERMNRDPLLANALAQLETLAAAMPAMANDMPRFTKLFDLLTDEMHIVLSRTRPYDDASFKQAASAQLQERAPSMARLGKDVDVTPHMVSSGMDALTTGVAAARIALGQPAQIVGDGANYFETPAILSHTSIKGDEGRLIVGSLNPSTPTTPPSDVRTLIATVKQKLESAEQGTQFALVVDVTIERGTDGKATDVDLVFADPAIAKAIDAGVLSVTVCKSYQKYPGLGVGKVMAGSTTTIAKKGAFSAADEFLANVDKEQNFMQNDESQLMAHLVAKAGPQEIGLEKAAARNAGKLAGMLSRRADDPTAQFNEGLPFVLVSDGATPLIGPDKRPIPMAKLLPLVGVEERDSFGFQNSSYLEIPSGIRINTGQESEEGLTEKFFALSNIGIKTQATNTDTKKHYDTVLLPQFQEDLRKWNEIRTQPKPPKPVRPPQPKNAEFGVGAVFDKLSADLGRFDDPAFDKVVAKGDPLPDKIRKLGKAFKPETDLATLTTSQDPSKIMESVSYGPLANKLGKVNNEIASYLLLAKGMVDCGEEKDRKNVDPANLAKIREMHEAFIEGGMHGVTPETRALVLANWMNLSLAAWPADEKGANAQAAKVEDFAGKMPYREDKAKAFVKTLSDEDFAKAPPAAREKVLAGLFGPLDIESKLNVAAAILRKGEREKAGACLDDLQKMLGQLKDGSYAGPRPDQLSTPKGKSKPTEISPREIAAFETRIEELEDLFFSRMPLDALEATSKANAEMEAAGEFLGTNRRPRPAIDGERKALLGRVEDTIVRAERVLVELGRSASSVTQSRDKREVARCIKGLHGSTSELKKLAALYA